MVSTDVLDLREDPVKGVCIAGLSEIEVDTPEEILDLLMYLFSFIIKLFYLDSEIVIEHKKQLVPTKHHLGPMQFYRLFVNIKIEIQALRLSLERVNYL